MNSSAIRRAFLDYFAGHGHRVVRSSSVVPANDPTLYFANAGMVQFKDVFVGDESREYRRAASTQKCLRVSGKHNDLSSVGRTSRHHTFFEMLGNFSFGDYFKREAIGYAWDFLTGPMGLEPGRLTATVFAGEDGIPADEESFALWRDEVGLPEDRIQRLGKSDNFWSMGETGPCGPCSELHYHQGDHLPCPEPTCRGVACECDRWVEVWNLVFMQYNRSAAGELAPLAQTGVDTGMGLERLVAVKQGVTSNYDTDLFQPLIQFVAELTSRPYGANPADDVSIRVVADHARATAICIADGVFPEKGGREYVLRRIMRRAIRHGKRLGLQDNFLHLVCRKVVELLGEPFPELVERGETIVRVVQAEETSFRRTLDRGLQLLGEEIERARAAGAVALPVEVVGYLYDTHGFPFDLTHTIAEEHGLAVDEAAAQSWVKVQHAGRDSKVGDDAVLPIYKALLEEHGPTRFLGYDADDGTGTVLAIVTGGELGDRAGAGTAVEIVTSATPFYGRAGGQVGDSGTISWPGGGVRVTDTLRPGGSLFVHQGEVVEGELTRGQEVVLSVDTPRRDAIRRNHSATHLLHHALRQVLGEHVAQKGSEVAPAQLRFDFSHFEAMTDQQIAQVERLVNAEIRKDEASRTEVVPFDEAQRMGATALFGEKYGDRVRVVHIGSESLELCGGTHVGRAGEIGLFKIVGEEALALGVRRIVACTGEGALDAVQRAEAQLRDAASRLRCGADQVAERIEKLQDQLKQHERELDQLRRKLATGGGEDLMSRVVEVAGTRLLAARVEAADPKTLREAGDHLRDRIGTGVVVLGGEHKGKAALLVVITRDLTERFHAGKLVGQLARVVEGKGGGRPDMAQAGGPRADRLDEALEQAAALLRG